MQQLKEENQKLKREINKLKGGHTQTTHSMNTHQITQSIPTEEYFIIG